MKKQVGETESPVAVKESQSLRENRGRKLLDYLENTTMNT